MHENRELVEARINRFLRERLPGRVWRERQAAALAVWEAPGEPVPFSLAVGRDYRPFSTGSPWGAPWGTTWFRVSGTVPEGWEPGNGNRAELLIDLGFPGGGPGFGAEALVYTPDGGIVKAVEQRNMFVPLPQAPGEAFEFYVEAASNPNVAAGFTFAPTPLGDRNTAGEAPLYVFRSADVALFDAGVWNLVRDFWTLNGLMHELPMDLPRRYEILRALERAVTAVDPADVPGTAAAGRQQLAPVLFSPAYAGAHRVYAVGHAHIDSAWLWPVRETVRKVARTFANVLELMDTEPEFVFTASSAQQYAWLQEHYPELFARVAERVREGRFVPTGGMWVESDTNMPSGESLARQFVAGKRFFREQLGVEPEVVWLPDSFGYSAALPQIARAAGARWFLTQKISWNETNTMPHSTFRWEGIDGTQLFTHFPPVDTYNSELSGQELARAQRQFAEKGFANSSLVPFGWGDGGGGPTREMLAAAHRTQSLEGSPTVRLATPEQFFAAAAAELADPPVWSGELYLEFHRGTYTSQANTKKGNRRSEALLHEAELWSAAATLRAGAAYPYRELELAWQTVLLQQFHDILPGTSIAWVHQEAERNYVRVAAELEVLIGNAAQALLGEGAESAVLNAGPYPLEGTPASGAGPVPGSGRGTWEPSGGGWRISSGRLRLQVTAEGLFSSLIESGSGREAFPPGRPGNLFQLFRDTPNQWDAWDLDAHYRFSSTDLMQPEAMVPEAGGRVLRIERSFGHTRITERVSLSPDGSAVDLDLEVDWHERQKLLKLAFPLDVHADRAASEIQFGHIFRPTHANTSWDAARFETVAHRWIHVGEPGFGVAVANDSTYGHDTFREVVDGRPCTMVRVSLLRAPLFPDPDTDQGLHRFRYSLRPASGIPDAVAEGYRLNLPLRTVTGTARTHLAPLIRVSSPAVVVETVKLAEDRSGDVVVRFYEAHGSRAEAQLRTDFPYTAVEATDLLERTVESDVLGGEVSGAVSGAAGPVLRLRPFELVTLRFRRA
ncbi:glycoside hydrolase family 38 C-terminal domain-containing protein [Arthrobacter sp. zg-Y1143]|uniref:alpha-mannosidase n=1 Tax=Arthrobacter sp. zg-Y1143 TaxID=3049065 RepID=UPI0024C36DB6|nr:glycoside hydrolase family 38 C-terminal domain-containing protein [Arthrobacter sp. zg-Y1143]MDK1328113.1 glycoside hydrolase family 38 C-terminal domain-containing protein [Arthrobacter sp. zg-Y1143]